MTLPVALDAMGGDRAPGEIVKGAREAAERYGIAVVLVGRAAEMGDVGGLPVMEASEVIEMQDDPAASVRRKKDSSLVRCAEAVRWMPRDIALGRMGSHATLIPAFGEAARWSRAR